MFVDDGGGHGQTQTRSTAEVFRAEVRIKHTRGYFRSHAPASVAHGELNKIAGYLRAAAVGRAEGAVGEFEGEPAALGHGIAGVDGEIEQRLGDLVRIGPGQPGRLRRRGPGDNDLGIDAAFENKHRLLDHLDQI